MVTRAASSRPGLGRGRSYAPIPVPLQIWASAQFPTLQRKTNLASLERLGTSSRELAGSTRTDRDTSVFSIRKIGVLVWCAAVTIYVTAGITVPETLKENGTSAFIDCAEAAPATAAIAAATTINLFARFFIVLSSLFRSRGPSGPTRPDLRLSISLLV